jgi:hypothetical protein
MPALVKLDREVEQTSRTGGHTERRSADIG